MTENIIASYVSHSMAEKALNQLRQRITPTDNGYMAFVYQGFWVNQMIADGKIYLCLTHPGFNRKAAFKILSLCSENQKINDDILEKVLDSVCSDLF